MTLPQGIYTLANDNMYDQVLALINSIRRNYDSNIPICIIPYDNKVKKLKSIHLKQVFLFNNQESLSKWQSFASEIWNHKRFVHLKKTAWYHGANTIRKLCCFDGIFEKFIYIDSDSLVMSSLEDCFNKLTRYDCVFDDWEYHKKESFLSLNLIKEKYQYSENNIKTHCHSSDFFASKSSLINFQLLNDLKFSLLKKEEVNFINTRGWWDEVYLFSYITFKLNCKVFNYTLSTESKDRTGNIAGVDPFVERDYILFNQESFKPIHRIHYMGYKSEVFKRLCQGEDTNIPHYKVFLYYRFMDQLEEVPTVFKKPTLAIIIYRFLCKVFDKIKKLYRLKCA